MMSACCACTSRGRCRSCICVKSGTACSNCLPSRNGKCSNSPPNVDSSQSDNHESAGVEKNSSRNELLPPFTKTRAPHFKWSDSTDGESFSMKIQEAYREVIRWKRNVFLVPSGRAGEKFVGEMLRLFRSYGESTPLESIAMTAVMTMPHLLLQKPHPKSKVKEHIKCLERRLVLWWEGNIEELLTEGRAIQQRLKRKYRANNDSDELARSFSKFMRKGKVKSAIRLLAKQERPLHSIHSQIDPESLVDRNVLDELKEKHPQGSDISDTNLVEGQEDNFHPIIFECIDGESIRKTALQTDGAAGPSGIDALDWRRLLTSFRKASDDLCVSLASVARKISSEYVDPESLVSFTACRLIAIDKNPGIRPIGIGEVSRRILSKAILSVIRNDIKEAAGSTQLCVDQISRCEAGVHVMRRLLLEKDNEAILFVDANNAFNSLNQKAALINIHSLCPSLAVIITNMYRGNAEMFIEDETILSKEGTTQGDPLAMSMYGIAILPLIKKLNNLCKQLWFADDAAAGGEINHLSEWWSKLKSLGPAFGYHPNPSKMWLLVKEEYLETAKEIFTKSGINISSTGRQHLGSALGSDTFVNEFVKSKIANWIVEMETLTKIARTEPQAAYAALTHGLIGKWLYAMRTIPGISKLFTPLEEIIPNSFIPTITGRKAITDAERDLLALPCRLGGLGIPDPPKSQINIMTHQLTSQPL